MNSYRAQKGAEQSYEQVKRSAAAEQAAIGGHAGIPNAGVQLRNYCAGIMEEQGYPEPTGQAKITPAFNLPSKYILHTVGPIVDGALTDTHREQLASCYRACLELAEENKLQSLAFCCISTGEFHFPNEEAAQIAVREVRRYRQKGGICQVIFNVFTEKDYQIYVDILTPGIPCMV